MNICDYIKKNNISHTFDTNGNMVQEDKLFLSHKGITCLKGFIQTSALVLSNNEISSLEGFVQTDWLGLTHNRITSLKGFTQKRGDLYLNNNPIQDLEGFVLRTHINVDCLRWVFKFDRNKPNILHIGCKKDTLEGWKKFFEKGNYYETDPSSQGYKNMKKYVQYLCKQRENNVHL